MTEKEVCLLDGFPQVFPCLSLRCARCVDKITSDLDVTAEYDWSVRSSLLDEGNQPWQLGVVNDDHVGAAIPLWD